jgi:hypothetical protein
MMGIAALHPILRTVTAIQLSPVRTIRIVLAAVRFSSSPDARIKPRHRLRCSGQAARDAAKRTDIRFMPTIISPLIFTAIYGRVLIYILLLRFFPNEEERPMKRILLALTILLASGSLAFAQGIPAWSLWQNQRGSTLEVFLVDPAGSFQGQFINQAAGFQCKGIPYPATGTSQASSVIFAVTFSQCFSHTTWSGVVSGNLMRTNWVLIYIPPNGPPQKLVGTDTFTRIR